MSTTDATKSTATRREDVLTKQRAGESRDEALKRRVVVLKPSNKDFRHLAILLRGRNGGLSSPVRRARFFSRLPQFALEVGDPLFSSTQSRSRRHQLSSRDKLLASFLCLRSNSLKLFVRLLDGGQLLLSTLFRGQSVRRLKLQTLHIIKKVSKTKFLSAHPLNLV